MEFIEICRAQHSVVMMCRLCGVTRARFYAWRSRERSERERQNEELTTAIRTAHAESRGTYGSPRVHQVLRRRGHKVGRHRVARLMRRQGIRARVATIRYTNPSVQRFYGSIPNQSLDLVLTGPNQVWVGDITYPKVGPIYRYLAVVMDKYSRRVIGWAYGPRKDVRLTTTLARAVRSRRAGRGIAFHTDRGVEYAAGAFKECASELGITQSMNGPGKITDNAFIESFFHSMKADVFHGNKFEDDETVRSLLKDYLPFYNRARLHSSLNYVPPATFDQQARKPGCQ